MARRKATAKASIAIDGSVFKDLADVIRAKNIFFVPFYGAFVAFLVGKSELVAGGMWICKAVWALTFFAGIAYASIVSQLLWVLETLRFATNVEKASNGEFNAFSQPTDGTVKSSSMSLGDQVLRSVEWENRVYRWMMWLLYFAAIAAMFEMYARESLFMPFRDWVMSSMAG